uniref:Uncharacterized protein n=1 Tax=Pleurostomum flabellatum TaxID=405751 RepID=A0A7T0M435_9EUKA|nr:hypothetical protein J6731_mgp01 [Pleurostomum flabellatum]QPL15646.1 hypothetical protein [Pleurostomum flabellatum]
MKGKKSYLLILNIGCMTESKKYRERKVKRCSDK